jgi:hypothetical protein
LRGLVLTKRGFTHAAQLVVILFFWNVVLGKPLFGRLIRWPCLALLNNSSPVRQPDFVGCLIHDNVSFLYFKKLASFLSFLEFSRKTDITKGG